ncbi:MAG: DUF929 family protein [Nocardioides sp.]
MLWTSGLIVGVVLLIGALVVVGLEWEKGSGAETTAASPALMHALSTIPTSTYDVVGAGEMSNTLKTLTNSSAMSSGGKPRVLYVGAEYCPYCGAERWAVVTALSRFGRFTHLGQTTSSHADVYPDTPTLSFHGASYMSKYLTFDGYETLSNQIKGTSYAPLDTLPAPDQKLMDTYDRPPYLPTNGSIPFIDFGGSYLSQGASYSPQLLHGLTHQQVANQIRQPTTALSKSVLGTANTFTAAMCRLTHGQPSSVCQSPGVTAAAARLTP